MKRVPERLEGFKARRPRLDQQVATGSASTFERVILPLLPYFTGFLTIRDILDVLVLVSKEIRKTLMDSAQNMVARGELKALGRSSPYMRIRRAYPRLIAEKFFAVIHGSGDHVRSFLLLGHPEVHLEISATTGLREELSGLVDAHATESKVVSLRIDNFHSDSFPLRNLSFPNLRTLDMDGYDAERIFRHAEGLENISFFAGPDIGRFHDAACRKSIRNLRVLMVDFDQSADYALKWSETHFPRLESLHFTGEVPLPRCPGELKAAYLGAIEGPVNFGLNQEVKTERLQVSFETIGAAREALNWPFTAKAVKVSYHLRSVTLELTDGSFSSGLLRDAIIRLLRDCGIPL